MMQTQYALRFTYMNGCVVVGKLVKLLQHAVLSLHIRSSTKPNIR